MQPYFTKSQITTGAMKHIKNIKEKIPIKGIKVKIPAIKPNNTLKTQICLSKTKFIYKQ